MISILRRNVPETKYALFILLIVAALSAAGQATNDYRSNAATMNWSAAGSWEVFNGSSWVTASAPPDGGSGTNSVTIRSGHTVAVDQATQVAKFVTVATGGSIMVNPGSNLSLSAGAGATDHLTIATGAIVTNSGTITFTSSGLSPRRVRVSGTLANEGTLTGANAGRLIFENGGTYEHLFTSSPGTIPTATWNSGSTVLISGYTTNTTLPAGLGQTFRRFTWNTPNLSAGGEFDLNGTPTMTEALSVLSTGSAGDVLYLKKSGGGYNITLSGDLLIDNGSLVAMSDAGVNSITCANATFDNGSIFDFSTGSGVSTLTLSGNFTQADDAMILNQAGEASGIVFAGTSAQVYTSTQAPAIGFLNYTVNGNAILDIPEGSFLGGTGALLVNSTSTLRLGSTHTNGALQINGAEGNIRVPNGSRTYNSGFTVEFNGTSAQFTGDGIASGANVIINNTSGVTMSAELIIAASRMLTFTRGKLAIGANTLTINGDISGMTANRSFNCSATSQLVIAGTGALSSNLFFDPSTPGATNRLQNFTLNRSSSGSATLGNAMEVTGLLTMANGTLNTSDAVTLVSNVLGTATVPSMGASAVINGKVRVERFIPSVARRWRFLSLPMTAGSALTWRDAWQNNTMGNGYNTFITGGTGGTGPAGTANYTTEGFDWTSSHAPSVYWYNEPDPNPDYNQRWSPLSNTTSNVISAGQGYRVFIRGDRSDAGRLNGTLNTQNATTLTAIGNVHTGNFSPALNYTSSNPDPGWNLLGNPYPSTLDWNAFHDAGRSGSGSDYSGTDYAHIDPSIYVFEAGSNAYISYNALSNIGGLTSGIVPSGASFFVLAAAANPSITFRETHKGTNAPANIFKSSPTEELHVRMESDPTNSDLVIFKTMSGATRHSDPYDIRKLPNPEENLSAYGSDQVQLTGSVFPGVGAQDTLFLNAEGASGQHTFHFSGINSFPVNVNMYLQDNHTSSLVNLRNIRKYPFTINTSVPSTHGPGRFRIMMTNGPSTLPVALADFNALKNGPSSVLLTWTTASESNNDHFDLERSADGVNFVKIGQVKGQGESSVPSKYSFTDDAPMLKKVNYYRVTQVDHNGTSVSYPVVPVEFGTDAGVIAATSPMSVYPIPAHDRLSMQIEGMTDREVLIRVYNMMGTLVSTSSVQVKGGEALVADVASLDAGVYVAEVADPAGAFVHQAKFVKE